MTLAHVGGHMLTQRRQKAGSEASGLLYLYRAKRISNFFSDKAWAKDFCRRILIYGGKNLRVPTTKSQEKLVFAE
jgi:hypothetical protein